MFLHNFTVFLHSVVFARLNLFFIVFLLVFTGPVAVFSGSGAEIEPTLTIEYSPNSVYTVGVLADCLRDWVECLRALLAVTFTRIRCKLQYLVIPTLKTPFVKFKF